MKAIFQLVICGMLLATLGAYGQKAAPTSAATLDVETIVNHMQTAIAGRNHDRAYTVTREYSLVGGDAARAQKVVAEVNAMPSGKKEFSITSGDGQAEKVVRKVLEHETEATQHSSGALSNENYQFALSGSERVDGHLCYVLQLTPKHDGKDILKGTAWIDADTFLVRKISGTPTKTPSWWIKDVQVTLHYAEVDGLWLQDSGQAVAQVRLVGKHTLSSRNLDVRTDLSLASKQPAHRRTRRADPALLGAGVFSRR